MQRIICLLVLLWVSLTAGAQKYIPVYRQPATISWADSVLSQMDYWDKIGQLFMVDAFSNKDSAHIRQITTLIDSFHIGGLIFFQGGPLRQAVLNNYYQSRSKYPLLIGFDGEWGLQMRLDSTIRFPRQMTLGAGAGEEQVYAMGREIGRQMHRMGVHVNFAPDIDINNNPGNPIINSRSFGENRNKVAVLGAAYMKGMQEQKVLACGKHFPGHGDTDTDSHLSLPVIHADFARIDSLELFPFKELIKQGLGSVMVAHLFVPAVDSTPGLAGSLSDKLVKGLLKDSLGFDGLVFTDALNMKGVAANNEPGELELKALLAGNDVLLYSLDIPKAVARIHKAIQECEIDQELIDSKVKKILMVKCWAGLAAERTVDTADLYRQLNAAEADSLNYTLYEGAPTLLRNKGKVIPLHTYYRDCIASVVINDSVGNPFQQRLAANAHVDFFRLAKDATSGAIDSLMDALSDYDRIIISVHNTTINATKNFGITPSMTEFVNKAGHRKGSILCVFGNAYVLGKFNEYDHFDAVIQAYEDTWLPQVQVAEKLFGGGVFEGHLPVSSPPWFFLGEGMVSDAAHILSEVPPALGGMNQDSLNLIDKIVQDAIADSVFPGCQVLAVHDGKIVFNRSFGYFTYGDSLRVKPDNVYDIASVTKIASTALACMLLVDRHRLDIDAKASRYLGFLKESDKKDITIRQLMAHEAGLQAWIPFWKQTVDSSGNLSQEYYRSVPEKGFTVQVAEGIYIADDYKDIIKEQILSSPLENPGKYVYSDLGLILLQWVVEKISGKEIDHFVYDNFYKPMGVWKMGYHPTEWTSLSNIVPTEIDTSFRHQLVHGFVHDPAAAMMGGTAGHAGVFSNARSLAVIMQMLLNKGEYGGRRYIQPSTVDLFTTQAFPGSVNRRALLFDKPDTTKGLNGPSAPASSSQAFGHSGFTGTYAWADPQHQLVFIFLSNRVYPSAANNKLAHSNLRTLLMQKVYEAIKQ
ncbi:MAG: glycoside hydrolase family 3 N-terminal domain-containing protein [Bacteroidia bacterium]